MYAEGEFAVVIFFYAFFLNPCGKTLCVIYSTDLELSKKYEVIFNVFCI